MLIGRRGKVDSRALMDALAEGKKQRAIAAEVGCSYGTIRRRLSRHVQEMGCKTVAEAVAAHVAQKIKRALPLALQHQVDLVMKPRR